MQNLVSDSVIIPALENGDRLTRQEFERRYSNMPDLKKAELIEGIVYMGSPLRFTQHGEPHSHIMTWLTNYKTFTPNLRTGDNVTVRLDGDNELQPDALLRIEKGGQSIISDDDYIEGSPELVVEIAASTVSIDLHDKLKVYCRNQVQEYIVWRVQDKQIDWFRWKRGEYSKLIGNEFGIIKSEIYPGLWLDIQALIEGDLMKVWTVLQEGMQSPEHEIFVKEMTEYTNSV